MTSAALSRFSVVNLTRFLWGAALFTLPITSFRYFPFLGDGTYVRPLSLYPVALLLPLLVFQLHEESLLPRLGSLTPLLAFVLLAFGATALGFCSTRSPCGAMNTWGKSCVPG